MNRCTSPTIATLTLALTFLLEGSSPSTGSALLAQDPLPRVASTRVAPHGSCKVAGTFLATAPAFLPELGDQPLLAIQTVTPLDPTCRRFAFSMVPVNPELTFAGIFPEAVTPPGLFGSLVREGGTYRVTAVAPSPDAPPVGVPIRGRVVYFWTLEGSLDCIGDACGGLAIEGLASLYSSIDDPEREIPDLGIFGLEDQDRDDDGFADEGEVPLLQAPFPLTSRRVGASPQE